MRSRLVAGLAFAGGLFVSHLASAADDVRKGPYLLHVGPTSVDVRVELAKPAALSVDVALDAHTDAGPTQTVTSPVAAFHSVHVASLVPGTRYRYAVHEAGGPAHGGTFVTAPADTSHEPFTFLAYGDNRTDGPAHERVVQAIRKESFDFLVHTGDFVIAGGEDAAWQTFFDIEEPILRDHGIFACVGNHELVDDKEAAHFERYFGAADSAGPLYGTVRWGRARIFLLNAFQDWGSGPERAWLEEALTHADHEAGVDLRIAVIHYSPWAAGPHGDNKRLLAAHIDDLLVEHHVDLVFAGHDHIYERGEAKGLKYVITGGGGAPLYRELTPVPSTRKVEATYNYVLTTVTDEDVSILSKRPDGSTIEQCSFKRGGSWLCDPPPTLEGKPVSTVPSEPPPAARCGCDVPGGEPGDAWAMAFGGLAIAAGMWRRKGRMAPLSRLGT